MLGKYGSLLICFVICGMLAAAGVNADIDVVAGTTNIAAAANGGQVIAVSDEAKDENGHVMKHWQASNAIDGLHVKGNHTPPDSYGWSTSTAPSYENPHWIVLAFDKEPKTHLISRVVIDPVTDDPKIIGRWVRNIEIQVSTTEAEGPYRTVSRHLVENKAIKQAFDFPPRECRYLRILIYSNHGSDSCVELGEIEVYEAIVGHDQLDSLIIRLENLLHDLKTYRDTVHHQQERAKVQEVTEKSAEPAGEEKLAEGEGDQETERPAAD